MLTCGRGPSRSTLQCGFNRRTQGGRYLGQHAKPRFKRGPGLVQQHAQAVHSRIALLAGGRQQRRFQRHINNIGYQGVAGQRVQF